VSRDEVGQRVTLAQARAARMDQPAVAEAYDQARVRFELAETVRVRREELGWSQRQLAERAGMTQPGVARFEAGGTTPTLPLLERLAAALGLRLSVSFQPGERRTA
jgi:HTH-type transcriptional regulator / antitoxin HipB